VERGESPFLRPRSFRFHAVSEKVMVKPAKSSTNVFHFAVPRLAAEEQLERWTLRGRMTGSTAHQDVSGLKHALQLGVGSAIIVLTVVLAWQQ
jgi:hypothetical protein